MYSTVELEKMAAEIAAEIEKLDVSPAAKVWAKGGHVRIYVDGGRRTSTRYGYLEISAFAEIDSQMIRGCVKKQIAEIVEKYNK